ncbi:MAG TPA: hypothetical protein H9815_00400 [Candidatus Ruania gallistercoris]|uniref:Uncharacterized protein n=1 Tax=Candidatus Ruania gallistercoris TaxID=2838746 RepID=A0A9D2EBC6_9MICO|nr:hypothetical protein [Candidatus Ruania gallistercoris]
MKPLPRFWTDATGQARSPDGKELFLRLYGWSTSSIAEAAQVARQRLAEATAAVRSGRELTRGGYYPRTPLREEILTEVTGDDDELIAAITRNRYGAEVLNTDAVLIADVDLPHPSVREARQHRRTRQAGPPTEPKRGLFSRLFRRASTAELIETTPPQQQGATSPAGPEEPTGAETAALATIETVAAQHPPWGFRTYRTAAGLRVIITGSQLLPGSSEAEQLLRELDSDPLYVRLCGTHETYRARLTPKPWRVGRRALTVTYPYEQLTQAANRWLQKYTAASEGYATCALVSSTGPAPDAVARQVLDLHDQRTRTDAGLPLA